jgi:adenine-specific DNA glycosylase
MEIGSQVCKPKDPLCNVCPLQSYCTAYRLGQTDKIPPPKEKKVITPLRETALLLQAPDGNWMLRRCKPSERWAGLWDFPRYDTTDSKSDQQAAQIAIDRFNETYGVRLSIIRKCTELQHSVTRYRIRLDCYEAALPKKLTAAQRQQLFGNETRGKSQSDGVSAQTQTTGQGRGAQILKEATPDSDELAWLPLSELRNIALSSSGRKLCKWLESASG